MAGTAAAAAAATAGAAAAKAAMFFGNRTIAPGSATFSLCSCRDAIRKECLLLKRLCARLITSSKLCVYGK